MRDFRVRIRKDEFEMLTDFKRKLRANSYPETFKLLFREIENDNKNEKPPKFRF